MDANRRAWASRPVHLHVFLGRFSTSFRRQSERLVSPSTPCTLSPRLLESHHASELRESREITVSTHGTPAQRPGVAGTRSTVIRPAHSSRTASCCLRRMRAVVRRSAYRWYHALQPTTVHQTTCADNVQQTTCSRQRAADSRQRAVRSRHRTTNARQGPRHATTDLKHSGPTCRHAVYNVQHVACPGQRTTCDIQRTPSMMHPKGSGQNSRQRAERATHSGRRRTGGCEKKTW